MPGSLGSSRYNRLIELMTVARREAQLTQQQVADRLHKPQSFVAKFERGERRLDLIEFIDLAKAIKIDPRRIIDQIEDLQE